MFAESRKDFSTDVLNDIEDLHDRLLHFFAGGSSTRRQIQTRSQAAYHEKKLLQFAVRKLFMNMISVYGSEHDHQRLSSMGKGSTASLSGLDAPEPPGRDLQ